jgi:hypothetical protein
MPLHWNINHGKHLMVVAAEGSVAREEVDQMLDEMVAEGALGYRKLFDGTHGDTAMPPSDLLALGVRMRTLHHHGTMGPLAVIVPANKWGIIARVLGILATANRPMRIFKAAGTAHRWLEKNPVSRASLQK